MGFLYDNWSITVATNSGVFSDFYFSCLLFHWNPLELHSLRTSSPECFGFNPLRVDTETQTFCRCPSTAWFYWRHRHRVTQLSLFAKAVDTNVLYFGCNLTHTSVVVPCRFIEQFKTLNCLFASCRIEQIVQFICTYFQLNHQIQTTGKTARRSEEEETFLWDYNCSMILCHLILELIMCPCSYCAWTAVTCHFLRLLVHAAQRRRGLARKYSNVATRHMQMWPRHIFSPKKPAAHCQTLLRIAFPGKILPSTPTWPLPPRPFLPTSSLILCHADGCNCQTVLWRTTLTCWRVRARREGEDGGWGGVECGPLILWGPPAVVCR